MRLIDADALFAKAELLNKQERRAVQGALLASPTIEVKPVRHGRWIEREDFNFDVYYDCSACGESFCFIEGVPEENFYRYCPNCGAKMDGDSNG